MIKNITLNLAGSKINFRYSEDFSVLEYEVDGEWIPFVMMTLACGLELDRAMAIETIIHKVSLN